MARLTKTFVDGLKGGDSDYFMWDEALPGFGVRVWPTGRKVYLAQYRAGRRTRRVKIATHGTMTVEEARKAARGVLGDVARGEDPQEERITRRKTLTVKELCERYLEATERGLVLGRSGRPKRASTLYVDRGRISRHIVPLLGSRLVRDLTTPDINRFLRDVTSGKTATIVKTDNLRGKAVVEGGAGTAGRTVSLLGGILSFAVSEGVIDANPAAGVKKPASQVRQRRLTPEEYQRLGAALDAAEHDRDTEQGIQGIRLLALSGCRLGEIVKLRWEEVDEAGSCFRLAETKTAHSVRPMGKPVFDVLRGIVRLKGCPYVLTGVRGKGSFGGMAGAWDRIVSRASLEDVTPHTLRHSYASMAGDLGYSEPTIAALLGHAAGSVTSRYVHYLDSVLVAAADTVSQQILDHIVGCKPK